MHSRLPSTVLDVSIAARGQEALEATRRNIEAIGRRCIALSADIGREEEWERIVN